MWPARKNLSTPRAAVQWYSAVAKSSESRGVSHAPRSRYSYSSEAAVKGGGASLAASWARTRASQLRDLIVLFLAGVEAGRAAHIVIGDGMPPTDIAAQPAVTPRRE